MDLIFYCLAMGPRESYHSSKRTMRWVRRALKWAADRRGLFSFEWSKGGWFRFSVRFPELGQRGKLLRRAEKEPWPPGESKNCVGVERTRISDIQRREWDLVVPYKISILWYLWNCLQSYQLNTYYLKGKTFKLTWRTYPVGSNVDLTMPWKFSTFVAMSKHHYISLLHDLPQSTAIHLRALFNDTQLSPTSLLL